MSTNFGKKIWMDGKFVDFDNARIHVLSHVIHYGSCVFEGLRCYKTKKGSAVFRLEDHIRRLYDSAKIYRMEIPISREDFCEKVLETVRINNFKECYIRPIIFRGFGSLGLNPFTCPIEMCISAWEWDTYLGKDGLENGIDVKVSTWSRVAPNTFPSLAKAGGNYLHSQLMKMEAIIDGYAEAIALDVNGYISEGSGENIFIIRNGIVYTPSKGSSILPGLTRDAVIELAGEMGYQVKEQFIAREAIYIADEAFFTGTAAEVSPIRSVDKIIISGGEPGPITKKIQKWFFDIVTGDKEDKYGWLRYL